ncbi:MAG: phasin family protein [Rhodospirillales bacterium]
MPKQSQTAAEQLAFAVPDFEHLSRMYSGGAESLLQSGNALMKAASELNAEILGFTKQRLDAGLAVGQSLAKCKTMQSALEIQMDYARTEAQIYLDEARKLVEMATQAANDGIKPLREHAINGDGQSNGQGRAHAKAKD